MGEVIEVEAISGEETEFNVVTFWTGGEGIRTSVMGFGARTHTGMTHWIGGEGTVHVMIGIGTGAENFATGGSFFVATSSDSSGVQKKVYSETRFGIGDVDDVETFEGEATSFVSLASGSQKKDRSEMDFM